jgi:hypothetical protein
MLRHSGLAFTEVIVELVMMCRSVSRPKLRPKALRRTVFAVSGGTSALGKTVNCELQTTDGIVMLSVPDALGALVLIGAAYADDTREQGRHIDDAAVLACTVSNPAIERDRMIGNDLRRIIDAASTISVQVGEDLAGGFEFGF